jgi:phosphinothricin acetyltransferase
MMRIREAVITDCSGIMKVLNSCILEENSFSALKDPVKSLKEEEEFFLSLNEREVILVAQEAEVVGFTCLYRYSTIETMQHVAGVSTFIHASVRGRGIGTQLNEALLARAKILGYEKLLAEVRKENTAGVAFYECCGFSRIAELKNQVKLDGTYDDIVLMERFI